jgi:hypothetical protein
MAIISRIPATCKLLREFVSPDAGVLTFMLDFAILYSLKCWSLLTLSRNIRGHDVRLIVIPQAALVLTYGTPLHRK